MRAADRAWLTLGAGVVAYELACPRGELLSEGVDRYLVRSPWATRLAVAGVALHLLNVLPGALDPLHWLSRLPRRCV